MYFHLPVFLKVNNLVITFPKPLMNMVTTSSLGRYPFLLNALWSDCFLRAISVHVWFEIDFNSVFHSLIVQILEQLVDLSVDDHTGLPGWQLVHLINDLP